VWRAGKTGVSEVGNELRMPFMPAIIITFILLLTFFAAGSEILGDWGNDTIAYHYLGPKVWLHDGIVHPVLDNCPTGFPAVAEILYAALMAIGGNLAPGLSAAFTLSIFFLVAYSLARRVTQDNGLAWWAAALVATMPAVYVGAHSGFVDVLYAGFVLTAGRIGLDAENAKDYAASGLFCGLAMSVKYTGILALVALIPCVAIFGLHFKKSEWRMSGKLTGVLAGVACLVASPFYLRNWIVLGSPIYPPPPGLVNIFHAKYMSSETIRIFHQYIYQRGAGLGRGLGAYLLLPYNLTYHTSNFHGAGGIGLTALALAPFGFVSCRQERFAKGLAFFGWLLLTMWFLTQQESRFLIPVYVLGAIFAVAGWRYALKVAPKYSRPLCALVILCSVLYGSFMILASRKDDLHAAFSPGFAEQQRQKWIPFRESFDYLNRDPAVRKVLILDRSVPPYYCDKSYLKPTGQWGEEVLPGGQNTGLILAQVHQLGISHVLDVQSEISGFQVPADAKGLTLVLDEPNQRIYRVE
jgi:hypothetical protein